MFVNCCEKTKVGIVLKRGSSHSHMQRRVQGDSFQWLTESWRTGCADLLVPSVKLKQVAVKVSEHVVLEHLLVAVQRELLAAHGADFPVALHVLLKLALVVVGWEDDFAERTPFHVHAVNGKEEKERI